MRYHPTTHSNIKVLRGTTAAPAPPSPSPSPPLSGGAAPAAVPSGPSSKDNLEHLSIVFNLLVSIIDHMIRLVLLLLGRISHWAIILMNKMP